MRPALVTFEGIDGAGKTTISRRVYRTLRRRGVRAVLTSEPTRSWIGSVVRRAVRDDVGPFAESLLFLADRAVHTEEIRRWLRRGNVVLCDRYADSTYAYQGARLAGAIEDPIRWLQDLSSPFVVRPDVTILLRVSPGRGLKRIRTRTSRVRFERPAFLRAVARNYESLAQDPRFVVVDGGGPPREVAAAVLAVLDARLAR